MIPAASLWGAPTDRLPAAAALCLSSPFVFVLDPVLMSDRGRPYGTRREHELIFMPRPPVTLFSAVTYLPRPRQPPFVDTS